MLRAVIYARYSPGPKQKEISIEGQIRVCKDYADKRDIPSSLNTLTVQCPGGLMTAQIFNA